MTSALPPDGQPPSTVFEQLPWTWQNMETKIVYIGVDGSFWNIHGNYAGKEGLTLAPHMSGFMHTPFASLFSEGPYQVGGVYERTDFKKRSINLGVQVSVDFGPDTSSWRYRKLEQMWWAAWSPSSDGYLCCYTRTHGWRFLRVRLGEEPKTTLEIDPTAFGNNFMQWDMNIVATQPYWNRKWQTKSWQNTADTSTVWTDIENILAKVVNQFQGPKGLLTSGLLKPGKNVGSGTLRIWNNGDQPAWPKYLVSGPGQCWIPDGIGGNMIPLPLLSDTDGNIMVDTDPTARTITSTTDPVDSYLYDVMSKSGLMSILLNDLGVPSDQPVWKRFPYFFTTPIPPATQANLKVYHSDPTGTVTVIMPQLYDRPFA